MKIVPILTAAVLAACLFINPAAAMAADLLHAAASAPASPDGIGVLAMAAAVAAYPIRLLQTAIIDGKPRSPAEGIQLVSKADRDRLVEDVKHAEDAGDDVEGDEPDSDGLEGEKIDALRTTAVDEGAMSADDAKAAKGADGKTALVSAIRDRRALFEGTGIDPTTDDGLRQIATDESIEVADDADTAAILTTIRDGRAAKA